MSETNPPSEQHSGKSARHEGDCTRNHNETMGRGGRPATPADVRFFSKVKKTETCWIWTAAKNQYGYGVFGFKDKSAFFAHRFSYEFHKGPIPEGMQIDHLCRNRDCVNPDHLQVVTTKQNVLRGIGLAAQNARKTHCPKGHPYSGNNLFININGQRMCRICSRKLARDRARNKRLKHLRTKNQNILTN